MNTNTQALERGRKRKRTEEEGEELEETLKGKDVDGYGLIPEGSLEG
jgi:hypothetical protein